jgi:hypothetical protein
MKSCVVFIAELDFIVKNIQTRFWCWMKGKSTINDFGLLRKQGVVEIQT